MSGTLLLVIVLCELLANTGIAAGPFAALWSAPSSRDMFFSSAFAASAVCFLARQRRWWNWWLLGTVFLAAALMAPIAFAGKLAGPSIAVTLEVGSGLAGLIGLAWIAFKTRGSNRSARFDDLLEAAVIPLAVACSHFFLRLTAALHPEVLDLLVFRADASLGFQPSAFVARLFRSSEMLSLVSAACYMSTPLLMIGVHLLDQRRFPRNTRALESFLWLALTGFVLYHVFPVIGPRYLFDTFPSMPAVEQVLEAPVIGAPVSRNCMPSLHTAWSIAIVLRTRGMKTSVRAAFGVAAGLTILATLGLGFHYAFDLVVAVPFAVALDATPELRRYGFARRLIGPWLALIIMTAAWLILLRTAPGMLLGNSVLSWGAILGTIVASVTCRRAFVRSLDTEQSSRPTARAVHPGALLTPEGRGLAAAVLLSGVAGLVYEVVFSKSLALTFGSQSTATTTVLATYMGGIALGAWLGGLACRNREIPLKFYAACEVGIAIWCATSPLLFPLARGTYVALATGSDGGRWDIRLLQIAVGACVLLPPTIVMGMTTPALARHFELRGSSIGTAVGLLYGVNTFGAALGTIIAGYLALPVLGVTHATLAASGLNLAAALVAIRLAKNADTRRTRPASSAVIGRFALPQWVALFVLAMAGVLTLCLEVLDSHLLAVVAGNSTYAFSSMLFAFLIGLSFGAAAVRRWLGHSELMSLRILVLAEAGLGASVLLGVFFWDSIPAYFASFSGYSLPLGFGSRETIRAVVCLVATVPHAFFAGAAFPASIDVVATVRGANAVGRLGTALAVNTAGNIVGALVGSFLLLPLIGSLRSIQAIGTTALLLSVIPALALPGKNRFWALTPVALGSVLLYVQPASFDLKALASGANVYFSPENYGEVVAHAESIDGGITTVARAKTQSGAVVHTLLANGRFQGDDVKGKDMGAQFGFALVPMLHTVSRGSALAIGYGTGVTARTIGDAGFNPIQVVELSSDVVRLADEYFAGVNASILSRPGVRTHITDGRNALMLSSEHFDLVSIELTSRWSTGAASLYNREFYELARDHLSASGVVQQWLQLHRLDLRDIASVLATVRAVFPYVALYFVPNQGVIVACDWQCEPSADTLRALDQAPGLEVQRAYFGGSLAPLLEARLLDTAGVDAFIASVAGDDTAVLVSTDDNLLLEYRTPRGNVRPYVSSLRSNLDALREYSAVRAPLSQVLGGD